MEGHIVWSPISVCVSDVLDRTDSHRDLTKRIDDGQVNDSPLEERNRQIKDMYS